MAYESVTTNILRVYESYRADIGFSNCYIILGREITLIDTGLAHPPKSILNSLKNEGRDEKDIKNILLTHAHPDILGGLDWLKKKTGASILASQQTADILSSYENVLVKSFNLSKKYNFLFRHKGFNLDFNSLKVDRILVNKEVVNLGETKLVVLETNGHCSGHLCYWQPETKILFSGDELTCYPNTYKKIMVDRTGSFANRELALILFKELEPNIICQSHDIPVINNVTENINVALEAQKLWLETALEYIGMKGEVSDLDVEKYVLKSVGINWDPQILRLDNHSTVSKLLEHLESDGKIQRLTARKNKQGEVLWRIKH